MQMESEILFLRHLIPELYLNLKNSLLTTFFFVNLSRNKLNYSQILIL